MASAITRKPPMPPTSSSPKRSRSVAIAFVSHAYPSYIHQIKSSITTTCTNAARPSPSTSTPVSCVIVKTKTRSKKSSRVETRTLRSPTARGAAARGATLDLLPDDPRRGLDGGAPELCEPLWRPGLLRVVRPDCLRGREPGAGESDEQSEEIGRREARVDASVALRFRERLQLRGVGLGLEGRDDGRPFEPSPEDEAQHLGVFDDVIEQPTDVAGKVVRIEGHLLHERLAVSVQDGVEELLLAPEVRVDQLLVRLSSGGDAVDS